MNTLPKVLTHKKNKRVGRGYGSGKGGHTSGRGQKGQKTRRNLHILFEGLKMKKSFIKRLPFMRGKGKPNIHKKPVVINLDSLKNLPKDVKVISIKTLVDAGIVSAKEAENGIKILGRGKIDRNYSFELPMSKTASEKLNKSGGKSK